MLVSMHSVRLKLVILIQDAIELCIFFGTVILGEIQVEENCIIKISLVTCYMIARWIGGTMVFISNIIWLYNMWMTAREGTVVPAGRLPHEIAYER